jgi:hypothetical protein
MTAIPLTDAERTELEVLRAAKAKRRAYFQTPEVKAKQRAYFHRLKALADLARAHGLTLTTDKEGA